MTVAVKGANEMSAMIDQKGEAQEFRERLQGMSGRVEVGSVWYLISSSWIQAWQTYVNFDDDSNPK